MLHSSVEHIWTLDETDQTACLGLRISPLPGARGLSHRRMTSAQATPRESLVMELAGLEPATSWVRSRRSPN